MDINYRIYVASLSDYNDGEMHGAWIDLEALGFDADAVTEAIDAMLKASPKGEEAEEYAIHDYEMPFKVDTYEDLEELCKRAEIHSRLGAPWAAYVGVVGEQYATESSFEEAYQGEYDSAEDYAEEICRQTCEGNFDSWPLTMIDWERAARELEDDGYSFIRTDGWSNGSVFVFSPC